VKREPRPIIYLRSATGGREALREQEHDVRAELESAGIATRLMHTYSDFNTPGVHVGTALSCLLHEASLNRVGIVIVRDLSRFGRTAQMALRVMQSLEDGGASILVLSEILAERGLQERLRRALEEGSQGRANVLRLLVVGEQTATRRRAGGLA
jgi:DNA invertase Pin-like site-specific DNA recombinase